MKSPSAEQEKMCKKETTTRITEKLGHEMRTIRKELFQLIPLEYVRTYLIQIMSRIAFANEKKVLSLFLSPLEKMPPPAKIDHSIFDKLKPKFIDYLISEYESTLFFGEEKEKIREGMKRIKTIQEKIIVLNKPLATKIMWQQMIKHGIIDKQDAKDIEAAALEGLYYAVRDWDPNLSTFSTYAWNWIERWVISACSEVKARQNALSIDVPIKEDSETTFADTLALSHCPRTKAVEARVTIQKIVNDLEPSLSDRERRILRALLKHSGSPTRAAEELSIEVKEAQRVMRKLRRAAEAYM